jgi:2-dehydropantoate 2-reductase
MAVRPPRSGLSLTVASTTAPSTQTDNPIAPSPHLKNSGRRRLGTDFRRRQQLVHLTTAAAMTCLMRANVGEIVRTPEGRDILLDQLHTSAAIAAANGHQPSDAFMRTWEQTFSQRTSLYATSMLRDIERSGRTEVEDILGFMLKKAREAGIACHTLQLAYTHIKAFEQRLATGRIA